jgi:hypothetical protein
MKQCTTHGSKLNKFLLKTVLITSRILSFKSIPGNTNDWTEQLMPF